MKTLEPNLSSRRDFLKTSGTAVIAGAVTAPFVLSDRVRAADNRTLRIGLIGCGGRGNGAARIDVPPERRFAGLDAFQKVMQSGVDAVLLTTPPGFRPLHFKAAVEA